MIKSEKEQMAKETNFAYSTVNNVIPVLVKKNLLIQIDRCVYTLNPQYFFKGYLKDRSQVIEAIIRYKIEKSKPEKQENKS